MLRVLVCVLVLTVPLSAATRILDAELAVPPSVERLDAIVATAQQRGWSEVLIPLREAAFAAYRREAGAAGEWLGVYRWAQLLATPRARAVERWAEAIKLHGGGHGNMATRYDLPPGFLSEEVSPALQRWLLGAFVFTAEFFSTVSDQDQPLELLGILNLLHAAAPATFADYASLALAISVVHDVPPPPDWPHGQVSPLLLPRKLAPPLEAFRMWVALDRANVTPHRLRKLAASELKFVVDASAPAAELQWARSNFGFPLNDLAKTYDVVAYRSERVARGQVSWPGRDYRLSTIHRDGGICVDQAYFATQVAKSRGVPTLLFRGAGLDGRHAWFGYLGAGGWVLDAGRHAEQRYVTGFARDPQTWRELTDHELVFLSERFRGTPVFRLSALHAAFAQEFLQSGDPMNARASAREAVRREPRNLTAWEALLRAEAAARIEPRKREETLREAMQTFAGHPDLEVAFRRRLIESLRGRGERSVAEAEELRLVRKHQAGRADLSLQQLAEILQRSVAEDGLPARVRTYERLLAQHGSGAGIEFFDRIVEPFVDHLRRVGENAAAEAALNRAARTLRVEKGRQLESEIARLRATLQLAGGGPRR